MKKGTKVVITLVIIVLFLVLLFFVFKDKVFDNAKTKVSDLVCTRSYPETQDKETLTIKFDKNGIAKEYIETQIIYFSSSDEAKKIYEQAINSSSETTDSNINLFYDSKMELENNIIKSSFYFKVEKGQEMYNKTKEELIQYYETEYMYECEDL